MGLSDEIMKEVKRYNDGNGCTRRQLVDNILILINQSSRASIAAPQVGDRHNPNCPYFDAPSSPVAPSSIPEQELAQAIADMEEGRRSHAEWAAYLRSGDHSDCDGCANHAEHIGDAAHHDKWVAKYNRVIRLLRAATPVTSPSDAAWELAEEVAALKRPLSKQFSVRFRDHIQGSNCAEWECGNCKLSFVSAGMLECPHCHGNELEPKLTDADAIYNQAIDDAAAITSRHLAVPVGEGDEERQFCCIHGEPGTCCEHGSHG